MTKTKTSAEPAAPVLIVLGYDEQQKPCGAQFVGEKPDLVAKAAELMDLSVYKASTPDLAAVAKKLPVGRLYANGRGFVPNVRQALYMRLLLRWRPNRSRPRSARTTTRPAHLSPAACLEAGTRSRLATSSSPKRRLVNGWWEAIVIDRKDDMLTLRFRDYPRLPKFFRHRSAVALMSPASDQT